MSGTLETLKARHPSLARALGTSGRLTFARFMELALYDRRWGYYTRRAEIGPTGDFYTSPEIHPLFAAAVAARAAALWRLIGEPAYFDLVEVGGGSGRCARDVLCYIRACFPDLYAVLRYRIDDRSPHLRAQQRACLEPHGVLERVRWTSAGPADWTSESIQGLIVANELLDALPVHLVTGQRGELAELYVCLRDGSMRLEPDAPSTPRLKRYLDGLGVTIPDGAQWEINLAASMWIRRAARALRQGGLLVMDYGYEAEQLYSISRPQGTLLCYAGHTLTSDPLHDPGSQDITTHVDFTTVRRMLLSTGLQIAEYRSQRQTLAGDLQAWRAWTQQGEGVWRERDGRVRSLDALLDVDGLGAVRWLMTLREVNPMTWPDTLSAEPPPSGTLAADHLQLADPMVMDPFPDIEEQWRAMWSEDEEFDDSE